ncbi:BA75_05116T0 [Komagataella pastoris]|uniref:Bis(5'-adenosyl)-triphosphatase n=1 Tax=Komagataella pastoris TaxID=4922 RepID=A0A1B2JH82_PICPA|nr:BA75_05116T0 [Komagataella pastoris]
MSKVLFSNFNVTSQVFYRSKYSYALVNLKPIVNGHVLVVPLRVVSRLKELTKEESIDYMETVQLIHQFIEKHYNADGLNIAIQDGNAAGQSVPHLHTHLIPRYYPDGYGDGIYAKLEENEQKLDNNYKKFKVLSDEDRKPRTLEEMAAEAENLAKELETFKDNFTS